MEKSRLESTAALLLKCGKKAYRSEVVDTFMNSLDLSSADEFYNQCVGICEWYDEIGANKKFFISHLINSELMNSSKEHLIIIPGAGKSPLALEILIKNNEKVNRILEIDLHSMDEKKELYDKCCPEFSEKIKCITADITSPVMLEVLSGLLHEFYNDMPCIVILEGITYFLNKKELEKIIANFKTDKLINKVLIEYLLPAENISQENIFITNKIFTVFKHAAGIDELTYLNNQLMSELVEKHGGMIVKSFNLMEMEITRTGANKYFKKANDGWLGCSFCQI